MLLWQRVETGSFPNGVIRREIYWDDKVYTIRRDFTERRNYWVVVCKATTNRSEYVDLPTVFKNEVVFDHPDRIPDYIKKVVRQLMIESPTFQPV